MALDLWYRFVIRAGWARNTQKIKLVAERHSGSVETLLSNHKYHQMLTASDYADLIRYHRTTNNNKKSKAEAQRIKTFETTILALLTHQDFQNKSPKLLVEILNNIGGKFANDYFAVASNRNFLFTKVLEPNQGPLCEALVNSLAYKQKEPKKHAILLGKVIRAGCSKFITESNLDFLRKVYPAEFQKTIIRAWEDKTSSLAKQLYSFFSQNEKFAKECTTLLTNCLLSQPDKAKALLDSFPLREDLQMTRVLLKAAEKETFDANPGFFAKIVDGIKQAGRNWKQYFFQKELKNVGILVSDFSVCAQITTQDLMKIARHHQYNPKFNVFFQVELSSALSTKKTTFEACVLEPIVIEEMFNSKDDKPPILWNKLSIMARLKIYQNHSVSIYDAAVSEIQIASLVLTDKSWFLKLSNIEILQLLELHKTQYDRASCKKLGQALRSNVQAVLDFGKTAILLFNDNTIDVDTLYFIFDNLKIDWMIFVGHEEIAKILFKNSQKLLKSKIITQAKLESFAESQTPRFRQQFCPEIDKILADKANSLPGKLVRSISCIFGSEANVAMATPASSTVVPKKTATAVSEPKHLDINDYAKMDLVSFCRQIIRNQNEADYIKFLRDNIAQIRDMLYRKLFNAQKSDKDLVKQFFEKSEFLRKNRLMELGEPLLSQAQKMEIAAKVGDATWLKDAALLPVIIYPTIAVSHDSTIKSKFPVLFKKNVTDASFGDLAVDVAIKYKKDEIFLQEFYGLLEDADRSFSQILAEKRVGMGKFFKGNKKNRSRVKRVFTEKENIHILGLMGEKAVDIIQAYDSELNVEEVVSALDAGKLYPAIYLGILHKKPELVEKTFSLFLEVASEHEAVAQALMANKTFVERLKISNRDTKNTLLDKICVVGRVLKSKNANQFATKIDEIQKSLSVYLANPKVDMVLIEKIISTDISVLKNNPELALTLACRVSVGYCKHILVNVEFTPEQYAQIIVAHDLDDTFKRKLVDNDLVKPNGDVISLVELANESADAKKIMQRSNNITGLIRAYMPLRQTPVSLQEALLSQNPFDLGGGSLLPMPESLSSVTVTNVAPPAPPSGGPPPPPPPPDGLLTKQYKLNISKNSGNAATPKSDGHVSAILERANLMKAKRLEVASHGNNLIEETLAAQKIKTAEEREKLLVAAATTMNTRVIKKPASVPGVNSVANTNAEVSIPPPPPPPVVSGVNTVSPHEVMMAQLNKKPVLKKMTVENSTEEAQSDDVEQRVQAARKKNLQKQKESDPADMTTVLANALLNRRGAIAGALNNKANNEDSDEEENDDEWDDDDNDKVTNSATPSTGNNSFSRS